MRDTDLERPLDGTHPDETDINFRAYLSRLTDEKLKAYVKRIRAKISNTSIAKAKEQGNENMVAEAVSQLSRLQSLQTMPRTRACSELPRIDKDVAWSDVPKS